MRRTFAVSNFLVQIILMGLICLALTITLPFFLIFWGLLTYRVKLLVLIHTIFRYPHLALQLWLSDGLFLYLLLIHIKLLELMRGRLNILVRVDAMRGWVILLLYLLFKRLSDFMQLQKWEPSRHLRFLFSILINQHTGWFEPIRQPLRLRRLLLQKYTLFDSGGAPFSQHLLV
jgi:hypothetical protein